MNSRRETLLRILADGREHSGEDLAATLTVSRAAVWKHIQSMAEWGVPVHAVPRRGYRLERPLNLLDQGRIAEALERAGAVGIDPLRIEFEVDSTNTVLLTAGAPPIGRMGVCIAEFQTAGRGRRGRHWVAPLASGLCLSMSWLFRELPPQISSLALAIGVAVSRALESCGASGIQLKWPNDLLRAGSKLGGILLEMRAEAGGPAFVVIGVGINVDLPTATRSDLTRQGIDPADLRDACAGVAPDRSQIAAAIVAECLRAVRRFEDEGFAPFVDEWRRRDGLEGQTISIIQSASEMDGVACGIDADGALLLRTPEGVVRQVSGEVSLRRRTR